MTDPAALTLPDSPERGEPVVITGEDFATTHAFTLEIEELGIKVHGTTDSSGNLTTASLLDWSPAEARPYTINVSDGTTEVTGTLDVFQGE